MTRKEIIDLVNRKLNDSMLNNIIRNAKNYSFNALNTSYSGEELRNGIAAVLAEGEKDE